MNADSAVSALCVSGPVGAGLRRRRRRLSAWADVEVSAAPEAPAAASAADLRETSSPPDPAADGPPADGSPALGWSVVGSSAAVPAVVPAGSAGGGAVPEGVRSLKRSGPLGA